jgi:hypothetical protein
MLDENITSSPSPAQQAATTSGSPGTPTSSRVRLSDQQLESISKDDLLAHWKQQDAYIDTLLAQATSHEGRKLLWFRSMNDCFSFHGTVHVLFVLTYDSVAMTFYLTEFSGFIETVICVQTLLCFTFKMASLLIIMCLRHFIVHTYKLK